MTEEDIQMLVRWLQANKDHKLGFLEKEAIKMALRQAGTVGDLAEMAVKLLKKGDV